MRTVVLFLAKETPNCFVKRFSNNNNNSKKNHYGFWPGAPPIDGYKLGKGYNELQMTDP